MTTVRAPAGRECVNDPVSRSPDGRVGVAAAGVAPVGLAARDAAARLGALLVVAAAFFGMPELRLTSGSVQPASMVASAADAANAARRRPESRTDNVISPRTRLVPRGH